MTVPASRPLVVVRHTSGAIALVTVAALLAANGCSLILGLTQTSALTDAGADGSMPARDAALHDAGSTHDHADDVTRGADRSAPDAPGLQDAGPPAMEAACCTCSGGTVRDSGCLVTLAVDASFPISLAVDTSSVYWASYGSVTEPGSVVSGSIVKVAKAGGTRVTLAGGQPFPYRLVVDPTNVYWVDLGNQGLAPPVDGELVQVAVGGGTPVTLAPSLATNPDALVVTDGTVYWTSSLLSGVLSSVSVGGGHLATIAYLGGYGTSITTAGGVLYWMGSGGGVWSVGVGSAATPVGLGGGQPDPTAIAAGSSDVYWLTAAPDAGGATVESKPFIDGGLVVTLATIPQPSYPYAIAIDSTSIYWTDLHANRVMKLPLAGGVPTTLIETPDASEPAGIAIDNTSVYWTQFGTGSVLKLTPK